MHNFNAVTKNTIGPKIAFFFLYVRLRLMVSVEEIKEEEEVKEENIA